MICDLRFQIVNWIVYVIQRTIRIRYCESLWVEILTVLAVGHSRLVTEHTLLSFDSFILDVEQHIARSVNRERERSVKPLWLRVMGYGLWLLGARCSDARVTATPRNLGQYSRFVLGD